MSRSAKGNPRIFSLANFCIGNGHGLELITCFHLASPDLLACLPKTKKKQRDFELSWPLPALLSGGQAPGGTRLIQAREHFDIASVYLMVALLGAVALSIGAAVRMMGVRMPWT